MADCNGVELPLLPVDVAIGNRAVKPIKRQENERKTQPWWKPEGFCYKLRSPQQYAASTFRVATVHVAACSLHRTLVLVLS